MAMHVRCSPSPSVIGGARSELLPNTLLFSLSGHVRQLASIARHGNGSKGSPFTDLPSDGKSHLPFWKAGSGHYGDTLGQKSRQIVSASVDLVLSHLDTIPVKKDGVFTFGDYGTNDGYASMPLMCSVVEHLHKKHGDGLTLQIIHEDQEKNDFNSLFSRLNDSSSYLSNFTNVYPFATHINFYKRCDPDGSCDVIFTSFATHWMERLDMSFKDCVFDTFGTKEECERFREETERDWTKFLALRAKELKPDSEKSRAIFADSLMEAHQVWSRTTFHSALSGRRTELEKSAILDELYQRFHSLVMGKDPESYISESLVSRMVARKV